jgi:hypothetical protein
MNDPRRPEQNRPVRHGGEPTERLGRPFSARDDPAYAGESFYPPPQHPGASSSPTDRLPQYWPQGQPAPARDEQPSESGRSKSPRWLWIAAAAAVLLVIAMVIALVIANGSSKKQTAVSPLPATPSSQTPSASTATTSAPTSSATSPTESSETAPAGPTETVVYNVTGQGRAISITYVDTDEVMQTEFNVALPWSKEVTLPKSGNRNAKVTITNIGDDVTCSLTVDGVEVRRHTGVVLTVCDAAD